MKGVMRYGKYEGFMYENVPREYLNYLYLNDAIRDKELEQYVLDNYERIMDPKIGTTETKYFKKYRLKSKPHK